MVIQVIGLGLLFLLAAFVILHRIVKRGIAEPGSLLFRLVVTALAGLVIAAGVKSAREGPLGAAVAMAEIIMPLVLLVTVWLPSFVELMTSGITGAFTGGNQVEKPGAFYFRAEALRKKGNFAGALAAIDEELAKFPSDFEGLMLRADIYASNYNNLSSAMLQLDEIEQDTKKTANQRVLAALKQADLLLKSDLEASRRIWERVVAVYPDSPASHLATQNLAHFTEKPVTGEGREPIAMPVFEDNVGLRETPITGLARADNPATEAHRLAAHLGAYPNDVEAREKLANLYADHYGQISLAAEQLYLLANLPSQPPRRVADWLSRISEWYARNPETLPQAKEALQEIVDRYPGTAQSAAAQAHLSTIGRVVRAQQRTGTLKLGEYDQRIGLKQGSSGGVE